MFRIDFISIVIFNINSIASGLPQEKAVRPAPDQS